MARILFRLKGVPHEEAEAVRLLLDENHVEHYETPPGNWEPAGEASCTPA